MVTGCGHGKEAEKSLRSRVLNAPPELSQVRPRALTNPNSQVDQRLGDFSQAQADILRRLPPEVRRIIWKMVLGGHLLHIARIPRKLVAIECARRREIGPHIATSAHDCWVRSRRRTLQGVFTRFFVRHLGQPQGLPHAAVANLLPILQTCRLIYAEAVTLLYKENIFDIDHVDTLFYLERSVLRQWFSEIRCLNLSWRFKRHLRAAPPPPHDFGTWKQVCTTLNNLNNLRELTIHLSGTFGPQQRPELLQDWISVLEALKDIKLPCLYKYEVMLPWSQQACRDYDVQNHQGNERSFRLFSEMGSRPTRYQRERGESWESSGA